MKYPRCESQYQNEGGRLVRCTRVAQHRDEPKIGDDLHRNLTPGHKVKWPDSAAVKTEQAAFEEWKANKRAGALDLSASAFNLEQEAHAAAWDKGALFALEVVEPNIQGGVTPARIEAIKKQNPHRKPGMTGHVPS